MRCMKLQNRQHIKCGLKCKKIAPETVWIVADWFCTFIVPAFIRVKGLTTYVTMLTLNKV